MLKSLLGSILFSLFQSCNMMYAYKRRKAVKRTGWKVVSGYGIFISFLSCIIFCINRILALFFLVLSIPIFIVIGSIIKILSKGPIFYKGVRLGLHKRPFLMYKFRTLPVGADKVLGSREVSPKDFKLPWFSKFLRDTRLDELPQLINILKGEMDFVGPRPIRPEVYEQCCRAYPNYDARFLVRPGLIGFSQLCTPHSAPQRIRSIIDNRAIVLKRILFFDVIMIMVTAFIAIKKTVILLWKGFINQILNAKILGLYTEKRRYERIPHKEASCVIYDKEGQIILRGMLTDINEEYFKIVVKENGEDSKSIKNGYGKLCYHRKGDKPKRKTAHVYVSLYRSYFKNDGRNKAQYYVFKYEVLSSFDKYLIDQYFLQKSILSYG